jgi:beta-lactamase class A
VTAAQAEKRIPGLDGLLDGLLPEPDSDYALVIEDLGSGARTAVNADESLPSASLYKLGVAWAIMQRVDAGTLHEDDLLTIEDDDAVEPEPYGGFGVGDTPTVRDALQGMLSVSSNAAAHALLRTLGRDGFAREMDRIGLHQTRAPEDGQAVTSADDMARLLRLMATSPELSANSRVAIWQGMASIAPPDALRETLPESVSILDKTGNLNDASNVGALLETPEATAILVVIDSGVNPGDARAVIARAGQIAYRALLDSPATD